MNTTACDPRLLALLVCPVTKTRLTYDAERQELVSRVAGLAYPIRDGIPAKTVIPEKIAIENVHRTCIHAKGAAVSRRIGIAQNVIRNEGALGDRSAAGLHVDRATHNPNRVSRKGVLARQQDGIAAAEMDGSARQPHRGA